MKLTKDEDETISIDQQIISAQEKHAQHLISLSKDVPEGKQWRAIEQIKRMSELREQFKGDFDKIQQLVGDMKQRISDNLLQEDRPYGLLTKGYSSYIECLQIDQLRFLSLFNQDEVHWQQSLVMARKSSQQYERQMKAFMEESQ